jgi:hypothetical protein
MQAAGMCRTGARIGAIKKHQTLSKEKQNYHSKKRVNNVLLLLK